MDSLKRQTVTVPRQSRGISLLCLSHTIRKANIDAGFERFMGVHDLNFRTKVAHIKIDMLRV